MQVNSRNIGAKVLGPDGARFVIPPTTAFNWEDNANAGVALAAEQYRAALVQLPNGTDEARAQQTYSGYNAGPSGRERYHQYGPPPTAKSGYLVDKRDYEFLQNYRKVRL
jgi:hypothetical protein